MRTQQSNNPGDSGGRQKWEDRILIVRRHFEKKGYRVHSGLQFGCELVLYADDPAKVHSDFCVHVVPEGQCAFLIGRFLIAAWTANVQSECAWRVICLLMPHSRLRCSRGYNRRQHRLEVYANSGPVHARSA
jgi:hypothetical protein